MGLLSERATYTVKISQMPTSSWLDECRGIPAV
jgi:hypothetical protein